MAFQKWLYSKYFINTENGIHNQKVNSRDEGESLHQIKFNGIFQVPNILVTNIHVPTLIRFLLMRFLRLFPFCCVFSRSNFLLVSLSLCNRYSLSILFLILNFFYSCFIFSNETLMQSSSINLILIFADWKKRRPFLTMKFFINILVKRCRGKMNSLSKAAIRCQAFIARGFPFQQ